MNCITHFRWNDEVRQLSPDSFFCCIAIKEFRGVVPVVCCEIGTITLNSNRRNSVKQLAEPQFALSQGFVCQPALSNIQAITDVADEIARCILAWRAIILNPAILAVM